MIVKSHFEWKYTVGLPLENLATALLGCLFFALILLVWHIMVLAYGEGPRRATEELKRLIKATNRLAVRAGIVVVVISVLFGCLYALIRLIKWAWQG
jgi:hypothetical protein